jgi:hypothetical protein
MNTTDTLEALRRANPRHRDDFPEQVQAATETVRARLAVAEPIDPRRRRSRLPIAGVALAAAAAVAVFVTVGTPGGGPGVESARAAIERAATVTAASADRSGIAVVRITHDGLPWAGRTIRWNGDDLESVGDFPRRESEDRGRMLVVDGMLYGTEDGAWVEMGGVESIDPDSGTTPSETLAALREDVGGATLRRFTRGMTGLTMSRAEGGATVYRGRVPAGLIAREAGFKEGQAIRVFPFGYVAHDAAANPNAPLNTRVTVAADGIVREIAVSWGTWTYTVTYRGLGSTPAIVAPEQARPFRR